MANLSSNGANYQHSGLENLRANETDFSAPVIKGTGPATNRIAAKTQTDGTANLRAEETDVHAGILAQATRALDLIPGRVSRFNGAKV
jgi:hypothetical protein